MFYETVFEGKTLILSDMLQGLTHYFTTRSSFLAENKDFLARITGIPAENFIAPRQIHSANIAIAPAHGGIIPDTDALILKNKGFALTLNFADCTPVILFDPVLNIAAGIHAGWRGTAALIAQKTALKMIELGSKQEHYNELFGEHIAETCDVAIIVGEYNREAILNGIKRKRSDKLIVHTVPTFAEAQKKMLEMAKAGDTVLYENDLPDTFK